MSWTRRVRSAGTSLAFVFCLSSSVWGQGQEVKSAYQLVADGDYSLALSAARNESDPLARAQAELYVFHHAGLLLDALRTGLAGLELAPEDPWLLDRCTYVAISLGLGDLSLQLCRRLQAQKSSEEWTEVSWMLDEALTLQAQSERERDALQNSKLVTGVGSLLALVSMLVGLRRYAS